MDSETLSEALLSNPRVNAHAVFVAGGTQAQSLVNGDSVFTADAVLPCARTGLPAWEQGLLPPPYQIIRAADGGVRAGVMARLHCEQERISAERGLLAPQQEEANSV